MLLRPLATAPPACAAWSSCLQRFKFNKFNFFGGKYVEFDIPWSLSLVMIAATASSSSAMYSSIRRRAKFFWTSSWKKVREKVKKKIIKLWRLLEETLNQSSTYAVVAMPKRLEQNISFLFMRYVCKRENTVWTVIEINGNFLSYLVLLSQDRERQSIKQRLVGIIIQNRTPNYTFILLPMVELYTKQRLEYR